MAEGGVQLVATIPIDNVTLDEAAQIIAAFARRKRPRYVATANVHFAARALVDPEFQEVVRLADMITADGMPLVWLSRLLGPGLKERVTGADLTFRLANLAAAQGLRLFLLGGRPGVGEKAAANLCAQNPGLSVATFSPPFDPLLEADTSESVARIRAFAPHILLVSLGAGKAEKWIRMHLAEAGVPVSIGVGAAIDFAAGTVRRAPRPVQRAGLEWLWRIFQEPGRLAGRYAADAAILVPFLARQLLRHLLQSRRKEGFGLHGAANVLRVAGRLGGEDAAQLRREGERRLLPQSALAVDLSGVSFMDSAGLGALVALEKAARSKKARLVLLDPSPRVVRLLESVRLTDFFHLHFGPGEHPAAPGSTERQGPVDSVRPTDEGVLAALSGRLDVHRAKELSRELDRLGERHRDAPTIRLDMAQVAFVDSSGLAALISFHRRLAQSGRNLVISGLGGPAATVFRTMRAQRYLHVESSRTPGKRKTR